MTGGTVNVIEFEVKRSVYMQRGNPGSSAWKGEWGGKAVNSCRNYGTGGKADGDGLGGCSSSAVGGDGYLTTAMQVAEDDSHGYRTGSMGPDEFDCQGFVKWCLKQNGWDISPWGFKDGTGTGAAAEGLSKMGWDVAPYDAGGNPGPATSSSTTTAKATGTSPSTPATGTWWTPWETSTARRATRAGPR